MSKATNLADHARYAVASGRNKIINGDMRIDQRYAGAATANTINGYVADRWYVAQSVAGKVIAQRSETVYPTGFNYSLGITSQSAYAVAAGDYYPIEHRIEGLNCADLNWGTAQAAPVTISFWVRCSLTGTFGGGVRNSANDRSYPFSYTISAANTWEKKTVTIPGDTSGTWLKNNGLGLGLALSLGMGSTFSGTAGAWVAGNFISVTGTVSVVGTNAATFYVTGVQLEVGLVATPFEHLSYGRQLALCQRYYAPVGAGWSGMEESATSFSVAFRYPTIMRTTPTLSIISSSISTRLPATAADRTITGCAISSPAPTALGAWVLFSNTSGNTAGRFIQDRGGINIVNASAEL